MNYKKIAKPIENSYLSWMIEIFGDLYIKYSVNGYFRKWDFSRFNCIFTETLKVHLICKYLCNTFFYQSVSRFLSDWNNRISST